MMRKFLQKRIVAIHLLELLQGANLAHVLYRSANEVILASLPELKCDWPPFITIFDGIAECAQMSGASRIEATPVWFTVTF